jgi:uncharacterized protein (DUF488 family)
MPQTDRRNFEKSPLVTSEMQQPIFTIGHSTHSPEQFLDLLKRHAITAVCDVRSRPYSRFNPQFNRESIKEVFRKSLIGYVFLGLELGARSEDPTCYENGRVQYGRLAQSKLFQEGIRRVLDGMRTYRIALMCAEREPLECHRTILVGRFLAELGLAVQHVHADGRLEKHEVALDRLIKSLRSAEQHHMFRSYQELLADVYRQQEERIAYQWPINRHGIPASAKGLLT